MNINSKIFETVKSHNAQLLCVTKYWDKAYTTEIIDFGKKNFSETFYGIGENRPLVLEEKKISREDTHFIGNIQSRQLETIIRYANTIHSIYKISHLEKIKLLVTKYQLPLNIFLQINISQESQKSGINPSELSRFLDSMALLEIPQTLLNIAGLSAIGAGSFTIEEKIKEFQILKKLKEQYLPDSKISAGTSRDYEIALGEGIDIVRVGQALVEN